MVELQFEKPRYLELRLIKRNGGHTYIIAGGRCLNDLSQRNDSRKGRD